MGSPALEKVRSEALNLPESERTELACNLVASLDGPADEDAENPCAGGSIPPLAATTF